MPDTSLDATVASVIDVAAAYHPGTGSEPVAEVAVGTLMWVLAGSAETVANRIGLLVQSCEATAGLINAAVEAALNDADRPTEDVLHDVLRDRPPVRLTRRQAAVDVVTRGVCTPAGAVIQLDLAAAQLPFGGSSRPCPGQHHAVALAAGVVDALLRRTVR